LEGGRRGAVARLVALAGHGVAQLDAAASALVHGQVAAADGGGRVHCGVALVAHEVGDSVGDDVGALASQVRGLGHGEELALGGRWVGDAALAGREVALAVDGLVKAVASALIKDEAWSGGLGVAIASDAIADLGPGVIRCSAGALLVRSSSSVASGVLESGRVGQWSGEAAAASGSIHVVGSGEVEARAVGAVHNNLVEEVAGLVELCWTASRSWGRAGVLAGTVQEVAVGADLVGGSALSLRNSVEDVLADAALLVNLAVLGVVSTAVGSSHVHALVIVEQDSSLASELAGAVASLGGNLVLSDKGGHVGALAGAEHVLRVARGGQGILVVVEGNAAIASLVGGIVVGAWAGGGVLVEASKGHVGVLVIAVAVEVGCASALLSRPGRRASRSSESDLSSWGAALAWRHVVTILSVVDAAAVSGWDAWEVRLNAWDDSGAVANLGAVNGGGAHAGRENFGEASGALGSDGASGSLSVAVSAVGAHVSAAEDRVLRDTSVVDAWEDERAILAGSDALWAAWSGGVRQIAEAWNARVTDWAELVALALLLGDSEGLGLSDAASTSGRVAHAVIIGSGHVEDSVVLGLVVDSAVALSVISAINDLASAPAAGDWVTLGACELGHLECSLGVSEAAVSKGRVVDEASIISEVVGSGEEEVLIGALAVEDVGPGCHIGWGIERSQSEVLALAKLVAYILAKLGTDGEVALWGDLSINSHLRNTALEAAVSVSI
jgi:hypothetical protein